MNEQTPYPIGTPGQPWGQAEKRLWREQQTKHRSYQQDVLSKIKSIKNDLSGQLTVEQYGELNYAPDNYPLYALRSLEWREHCPTILVTGGVHGYETSGVHGALEFIHSALPSYLSDFNFIVAPCVSPWAYETINRWNPEAHDPNRCFYKNGPAQESQLLMSYVSKLDRPILAHIDLHETTDTDNTEFRPALAARDAIEQKAWDIPDGFYCVGDTLNPQPEFQRAIIKSVEKVTHIAPPDESNRLIGVPLEQHGVINYAKKELGLCAGFTDATFVSTTEVYPDSPTVTDEECNHAQVAAVTGALNFLKN